MIILAIIGGAIGWYILVGIILESVMARNEDDNSCSHQRSYGVAYGYSRKAAMKKIEPYILILGVLLCSIVSSTSVLDRELSPRHIVFGIITIILFISIMRPPHKSRAKC